MINTAEPLKKLWDAAGLESDALDDPDRTLDQLLIQAADSIVERMETFRQILTMTDIRQRRAEQALRAHGIPVPGVPEGYDAVAMHDAGQLCARCAAPLSTPIVSGTSTPWSCEVCGMGWPADHRREIPREDLTAVAERFEAAGEIFGPDLVEGVLAEMADKAAGTLRMVHAAMVADRQPPDRTMVVTAELLKVVSALRSVLGYSPTPVGPEVYQDWRHQNEALIEQIRGFGRDAAASMAARSQDGPA